jgi:hypothetical protein
MTGPTRSQSILAAAVVADLKADAAELARLPLRRPSWDGPGPKMPVRS